MSLELLAAMIADTAPVELSGTACRLFNLVSGIAMVMGSVTAGLLWDRFGASFALHARVPSRNWSRWVLG